ncbi:MAG: LLM class F420-dependent oxidoreductase [Candidatus Binataceae bacterium]
MKFGILAWVAAHTADVATVARKCEAVGFESFFMAEHAVMPVHIATRLPRGDGKIPDVYAHMMDPFVSLAVAAAVTNRMKIGTGICLVPERDPKVLAKEVATLDLVSGGRFIFGIGAGWLIEESRVMGVNFRRRWDLTLECIRAMKELWTKPEAAFEGEFVKFAAIRSNPKPVQKPHPPVHIGASGDRALRNTVAIGDGWAPISLSPAQMTEELGKLRRMCDEAGRDFTQMEITIYGPVGGKEPRRAIEEYAEAGVHRLVLMNASLAPDKYEREIDDFARKWIE